VKLASIFTTNIHPKVFLWDCLGSF